MKKRQVTVWLLLAVLSVIPIFLEARQENQPAAQSLWELEILRIKELYRLTDMFGDKIWPGFDTRKIPIAVNYDDRQEILINHPNPPKEFRVFKGVELDGQTIMIRDGCTKYISLGGVARINGIKTSYGRAPGKGADIDKYLLMMLHESFHVYQGHFWQPERGPLALFPVYDIRQAALIALENRVLYTAVKQTDAEKMRRLAKMFIAVRSQRREHLSEGARRIEDRDNFNEGTAFYTEVRLTQLLHQAGGFKSPLADGDPDYKGFSEAGKLYRSYIENILAPQDKPVTLGHHIYQNGMAQALLLDRFSPGWKKEMSTRGMTPFKLLERRFPLDEKEKTTLVAAAKEKFAYAKIREKQEHLVRERVNMTRRYLEVTGRRYRVYFIENPGRFKWKPRKPIYFVYGRNLSKVEKETLASNGKTVIYGNMEINVLPKGIQRLEKGDLVFESSQVPVILWDNYLEWVEPHPAVNNSDFEIKADKQEKGVYYNLVFTTGGFVLRVGRARIVQTDKVVEIHPLPQRNGKSR